MHHAFFQIGCAYSFNYPRHNYEQLPTTTELRRIEVVLVRDMHHSPLDPSTQPLNPLLKRGRWLVTGRDLDKNAERSFYVESMTDIRQLSEEDLEPLKNASYVVVEQTQVTFKAMQLSEALAFRSGRQHGTVCGVLLHGPRKLPSISVLDEPIEEFVESLET